MDTSKEDSVKKVLVAIALTFVLLVVASTLVVAQQPKPYQIIFGNDENVAGVLKLDGGQVCVITKQGGVSCTCACTTCQASAASTVPQGPPGGPPGGPPPGVTPPPPPPPPPPSAKGNCGVGNGTEGDTPGCPGGTNDGQNSGPGNPGRKGGK